MDTGYNFRVFLLHQPNSTAEGATNVQVGSAASVRVSISRNSSGRPSRAAVMHYVARDLAAVGQTTVFHYKRFVTIPCDGALECI